MIELQAIPRLLGPVINQSLHIDLPQADMAQPRALGMAKLSVYGDAQGKTRLRDLRQSGSLKLVFPQTHRPDAEAILVNTAGGITGGDQFALNIDVQTGAALTITTQAAERAYRAQRGEIGRVTTDVCVQGGAILNWLPQELILFERCALRRRLNIDLAAGARLLMVEPMVFGRAAMPEVLRDVMFQDRIRITRQGRPLYIDGMDLHGDATAHLAQPATANGAGAMASVVMVAPDVDKHLNPIRALLPQTAGASQLGKDMLVIRQLATDSFELRRNLVPILNHLTQNTLPTSWRL
ncbi:MAG: urease accessory protein UreD [Sulfitobacter sp.]